MKKTLLIAVVFILAVISLQLVVSADMGAPEIKPYNASISNVNGAKYYDYEEKEIGKLDYGTVIKVFYEIEDWETKERIATFSLTENEENLYNVNVEDIIALDSNNIKHSKSESKELVVLKENGIEISKGPAYGYEKTGVIIPEGEKLTGYRSEDDYGGIPWYYVTYKGTSGWICELNGAIGCEKYYKDHKILTPRPTKIYKTADYTGKVVATIPANTIITDFLDIDDWSQGYYVTFEGVSGYLSNGYCATSFPWIEEGEKSFEYEVNYPEVKLYKEANTNGEVLIENIPEGTKLKYFYGEDIRFTGWIYTTYNNISGWVYYIEDGTVYKDYLQYANDAIVAQESEELEEDIIENDVTEDVIENTVDGVEKEELIVNDEITEENKENNTMSSATQIVLLCAMFGVTIAVTSLVTIALVNRKKK